LYPYPIGAMPELDSTARESNQSARRFGLPGHPSHLGSPNWKDKSEANGPVHVSYLSVRLARPILAGRWWLVHRKRHGNDLYQEESAKAGNPTIRMGSNAVIDGAMFDKSAGIGSEIVVRSEGRPACMEGDNDYSRDGVWVVPKKAVF
jgi:hypothetical protein